MVFKWLLKSHLMYKKPLCMLNLQSGFFPNQVRKNPKLGARLYRSSLAFKLFPWATKDKEAKKAHNPTKINPAVDTIKLGIHTQNNRNILAKVIKLSNDPNLLIFLFPFLLITTPLLMLIPIFLLLVVYYMQAVFYL